MQKNSKSHVLIEQNESIKAKYLEQSKRQDLNFILQAIEIAEDCSYRYKNSKNERLLVEICLMKLCSISSIELKKKIKILPNHEIPELRVSIPIRVETRKEEVIEEKIIINKESDQSTQKEKIKLRDKSNNTPVSGLSISSLKIKKELEKSINKKNNLLDDSISLANDFDNDQLLVSWENFYKELIKDGRKNLASILLIDNPKIINENEIHFTLTNDTNKIELEKNKNEIIKFLKKSLKNSQIKLIINVDKIKEKKFIYTPSEKYEKLKSINPSIEKIRKDFKLNL